MFGVWDLGFWGLRYRGLGVKRLGPGVKGLGIGVYCARDGLGSQEWPVRRRLAYARTVGVHSVAARQSATAWSPPLITIFSSSCVYVRIVRCPHLLQIESNMAC